MPENTKSSRTFSVMAKPAGSACNLSCSYCYYKTKERLMSDAVLEAYIKQNFEAHGKDAAVEFSWHGGEPTLCGVAFFRRAVSLEKKYSHGRKFCNAIQTNGTLLDDDWCRFFKRENFLVGISIDGNKRLHDANRKYANGRGSYDDAARGLDFLRTHGAAFNTLTTINPANVGYPDEVYGFLREISDHMQFLPVVDGVQAEEGISADAFGDFLCRVLDIWRSRDIGKKFVQIFEAAVGNLMEKPAGLCVYEPVCGHAASVEADGSVYSCDWFTEDKYCLGNILKKSLKEMLELNKSFGMSKAQSLSARCLDCPHLGLCWGGCPKHRVGGANRLCAGYKKFFSHVKRVVSVN